MSSATVTVEYNDEDGPATMTASYIGTSDVLIIRDGRDQTMAVSYEAARALIDAIDQLRTRRAELQP